MHAIEIRLEAATSAQTGYHGADAIHDGDSGLRVRGRQQLGAIGENRLSGEKGKEKIDRCADAGEGIPFGQDQGPRRCANGDIIVVGNHMRHLDKVCTDRRDTNECNAIPREEREGRKRKRI